MKHQLRITSLLITLSLLTSCVTTNDKKADETYYIVSKVVDGDTFWIDDHSEMGLKVRLIGIDAPESRRSARKDVGVYGREAREYLKRMVVNKRVRLVPDVDPYDQYNRLLAYVYLEDGTFLNAHLIEKGFAQVMTVPPNVKYAQLFLDLQQKAKEKNVGLWRVINHHN